MPREGRLIFSGVSGSAFDRVFCCQSKPSTSPEEGVLSVCPPWGFGCQQLAPCRGYLGSSPLFWLAVGSKPRPRLDKGHRAPLWGCSWLAAGQICKCTVDTLLCVGRVYSLISHRSVLLLIWLVSSRFTTPSSSGLVIHRYQLVSQASGSFLLRLRLLLSSLELLACLLRDTSGTDHFYPLSTSLSTIMLE